MIFKSTLRNGVFLKHESASMLFSIIVLAECYDSDCHLFDASPDLKAA